MFVEEIPARLFEEFRDKNDEPFDLVRKNHPTDRVQVAFLSGCLGLITLRTGSKSSSFKICRGLHGVTNIKEFIEKPEVHSFCDTDSILNIHCGPWWHNPEEWGPNTPEDQVRIFFDGSLVLNNHLSHMALVIAHEASDIWNSSVIEKRKYSEVGTKKLNPADHIRLSINDEANEF